MCVCACMCMCGVATISSVFRHRLSTNRLTWAIGGARSQSYFRGEQKTLSRTASIPQREKSGWIRTPEALVSLHPIFLTRCCLADTEYFLWCNSTVCSQRQRPSPAFFPLTANLPPLSLLVRLHPLRIKHSVERSLRTNASPAEYFRLPRNV